MLNKVFKEIEEAFWMFNAGMWWVVVCLAYSAGEIVILADRVVKWIGLNAIDLECAACDRVREIREGD